MVEENPYRSQMAIFDLVYSKCPDMVMVADVDVDTGSEQPIVSKSMRPQIF